ncbi:hypothetical protein FORC9_2073 [Vibrio vulnificus]|nr:hypothetical protein FORC9_2073 [Vibrio vulnificus]ANH62608.1 hypothetical protein FORC16_0725 [Vibrio vulnificus]
MCTYHDSISLFDRFVDDLFYCGNLMPLIWMRWFLPSAPMAKMRKTLALFSLFSSFSCFGHEFLTK